MSEQKPIQNFLAFLRLSHEKEEDSIIHETIEKAIVFRGTNLWILIFAILVASVGLNMNSTAVIIGAMLISPLMGPINGVGYSVATYNFPLFRKSLINFGFSAGAGLITSTLYFVLTPIQTEHSELLARTSPTIYDVLIAAFGGLAGIVALSSKNKGNVLPGVAIATALMPPLCTAGYGVSIGNWSYVGGALYLFTINSVFIALAAMLVSQLLKLPRQTYLLKREIKNKNIAVGVVIALTVLPSLYLGYTLVQKENFMSKVEYFVQDVGNWEGNYLLNHDLSNDLSSLHLVYAGKEFDENSLKRLEEKAKDLGLGETKLIVEQGFKLEDASAHQGVNINLADKQEIDRLRSRLVMKERSLDSLMAVPEIGEDLLNELQALYPSVHGCSYANSVKYVDSLQEAVPLALVVLEVSEELNRDDIMRVRNWLKKRLKVKNLELRL